MSKDPVTTETLAGRLLRATLGVERPAALPSLLPGAALAGAIMLAALPLADLTGRALLKAQGISPAGRASPVSGVLTAILIGIVIRNTVTLPERFKPGIHFAVTKILRLGIILVGIKLSAMDVLKLGAWGVPVVATAIAAGLVFVGWFNRLLGLPPRLGTLIAAGTGICGVTAIVSTAAAIEADEREVAYAVANVTLFGLLGMLFYPYLSPYLLTTSEQIGLFLGTAVHETSQVIGAALTYREVFHDEVVLKAATVTKLTRNLFLAVVVPLLALVYLKQPQDGTQAAPIRVTRLIPLFILGFVAMSVVRSIGDATLLSGAALGVWDEPGWRALTAAVGDTWGSRYLLGTAMAGVGLGTSFAVFKGVGLRPFAVGLLGALLVGAVGLVMSMLLGSYVHL